jgi:hypothetical protein
MSARDDMSPHAAARLLRLRRNPTPTKPMFAIFAKLSLRTRTIVVRARARILACVMFKVLTLCLRRAVPGA